MISEKTKKDVLQKTLKMFDDAKIVLTEEEKANIEFVDEGKIGLRPAVEISYLQEEEQRDSDAQVCQSKAGEYTRYLCGYGWTDGS